jgi:hypothetical protein
MKMRLGFITNSSSTNFIIAWNGDKDDLANLLNKHRELFPELPLDSEFLTKKQIKKYKNGKFRQQIIDQILEIHPSRTQSSQVYIDSLQKDLEYKLESKERYLQYIKERDGDVIIDDLLMDYDKEIIDFTEVCHILKNKQYAMNVMFGTNEGDFQEETGRTMMYCGEPHLYNDDDFMIFDTGLGS